MHHPATSIITTRRNCDPNSRHVPTRPPSPEIIQGVTSCHAGREPYQAGPVVTGRATAVILHQGRRCGAVLMMVAAADSSAFPRPRVAVTTWGAHARKETAGITTKLTRCSAAGLLVVTWRIPERVDCLRLCTDRAEARAAGAPRYEGHGDGEISPVLFGGTSHCWRNLNHPCVAGGERIRTRPDNEHPGHHVHHQLRATQNLRRPHAGHRRPNVARIGVAAFPVILVGDTPTISVTSPKKRAVALRAELPRGTMRRRR